MLNFKLPLPRRAKSILLALCCLCLLSPLSWGATVQVYVVQNEGHLEYARALVRAALDAVGFAAEFADAPSGNERRNIFMISEGHTHLDMMPATAARLALVNEGRLRMVPVPLERGLLGYRVNLLLEAKRDQLAAIKTVDDLRAFSVGQHVGWMDIELYRAAGIPTKEIKDWSDGQFALEMEAGFIDLFPLGVAETLSYFLPHFRRAYPRLTLDPYILVHYPWLRFVWVSPKPEADGLYDALRRGFDRIVEDGRFLAVWQQYRQTPPPHFFSERTIIQLENPF